MVLCIFQGPDTYCPGTWGLLSCGSDTILQSLIAVLSHCLQHKLDGSIDLNCLILLTPQKNGIRRDDLIIILR